jgi:hypothetical protein
MGRVGASIGAAVIAALLPAAADARQVSAWTEIEQLRADLKSDRQAVVAVNLPLSEAESKAFWPVYKDYRGEVDKLGDRTAKLIAAYAANYQTMDETKATAFFNEWQSIERDRSALRDKYVPRVRKVLPVPKAARYFQIENKMDAIVNIGLAADIPLVPAKK